MAEKSVHDFKVTDISGKPFDLATFKGKNLLIVNVASKCGFTPQYTGLEALYKKYKEKDFEILGFPCNQFGAQEPGTEQEIQSFCSLNYNVTFPMFSKVNVNGPDAAPLFKFLKKEHPGILGIEAVKWNFTKFLVDKDGNVLERFAPQASAEEIEKDLVKRKLV